jgi:type II secretory pathway pseudopilin PulG
MNFLFQRRVKDKVSRYQAAFTLMETIITIVILTTVLSGFIYGYVQANWTAEWCSMSLAAQSYASQGAEQARAADWRPRDWPPATGPGTMDELPAPTNYYTVDFLDIPTKGTPSATNFQFWVTNFISLVNVTANPLLRQIRSDAVWTMPMNGRLCTNTVILLRASDQ